MNFEKRGDRLLVFFLLIFGILLYAGTVMAEGEQTFVDDVYWVTQDEHCTSSGYVDESKTFVLGEVTVTMCIHYAPYLGQGTNFLVATVLGSPTCPTNSPQYETKGTLTYVVESTEYNFMLCAANSTALNGDTLISNITISEGSCPDGFYQNGQMPRADGPSYFYCVQTGIAPGEIVNCQQSVCVGGAFEDEDHPMGSPSSCCPIGTGLERHYPEYDDHQYQCWSSCQQPPQQTCSAQEQYSFPNSQFPNCKYIIGEVSNPAGYDRGFTILTTLQDSGGSSECPQYNCSCEDQGAGILNWSCTIHIPGSIDTQTPQCEDTDTPNDINTIGRIVIGQNTYSDRCTQDGKIEEVTCDVNAAEGYSWLAAQNCPAGKTCQTDGSNGARCVEDAQTSVEERCKWIGLPSTIISAKNGNDVCASQGLTCSEEEASRCNTNGGLFGCHNCVKCCGSSVTEEEANASNDNHDPIRTIAGAGLGAIIGALIGQFLLPMLMCGGGPLGGMMGTILSSLIGAVLGGAIGNSS